MAYIRGGYLTTTKKERECIKIALEHAWNDVRYGLEGTYVPTGESKSEIRAARNTLEKGKKGLELLDWYLDETVGNK